MKIAIPTDDKYVASHFGRCEKYTLCVVENGQLQERIEVASPGHQPGYLPAFLAQKGVDCIIASGMGSKAQDLFIENSIQMILGCQGLVDVVINDFCSGKLAGGESTCEHDQQSDHCSH